MNLRKVGVSRRSLVIATVAVAAMISLGLGANAARNKISNEARQLVASPGNPGSGAAETPIAGPARVALVIGNSQYPDASAPLAQPVNDARSLSAALRDNGFEVELVEEAGKDELRRAVDRLKAKAGRDSVVVLFYAGYGIQAGRESYMIPVDANIWKERDVRRQGVSIESVLDDLSERNVRASIVVLDASRKNPFERRFRTYSRGLAAIDAPQNVLVLSAATPGKVVDDSDAENGVLVAELLKSMAAEQSSIEQVFTRTRMAVSQSSDGQQVPTVSSSLAEEISFRAVAKVGAGLGSN